MNCVPLSSTWWNPAKSGLALIVISSHLAGCSMFGPAQETLMVSSSPPGAKVYVNGTSVGEATPLVYQVNRSEDLLLEVRKPGYQTVFRNPTRGLSTLGLLDIVGGCVLLLPFIGLLSPAAYAHNPTTFGIILQPQDDSANGSASVH